MVIVCKRCHNKEERSDKGCPQYCLSCSNYLLNRHNRRNARRTREIKADRPVGYRRMIFLYFKSTAWI